jgi:hypothetical protein
MTTTGAEQAASSVLAFLAESSARGLVFAVVAGLALAVFRPRRAAIALCLWTVVLYAAMAMPLLERPPAPRARARARVLDRAARASTRSLSPSPSTSSASRC